MSRPISSPGLVAGIIAAVVWFAGMALYLLATSSVYVGRVLSFFGIGPLQARFWTWPGLWAPAMMLLSAVVLVTVTLVIVDHWAHRGNPFLVTWIAVIVAGTVLGLSIDVMGVLAYLPKFGWQGLASAGVDAGMAAAYWGVFAGWIPALLTFRRPHSADAVGAGLFAVSAMVVGVLLLVIVGFFGVQAWQRQIAEDSAEAQGISEEDGALPDPLAAGDPVPTTAPGVEEPTLDPQWCTLDRATLLFGSFDAALGQRSQSIHLANHTDQPCVIQGYPDVAFGDQNGHELDTAIAPDDTAPEPALVTVPAQGQATSLVSWSANSTNGVLVARTMWAAPIAGLERGSWPVELDIIAGASLRVTPWALDAQP